MTLEAPRDRDDDAIREWVNDIHQGDVRGALAEMPADAVHCALTSPPYYGLRDYGVDGQIGLEDSLDEYIETLVAVGDRLRRVLRPDGSWWLNLGDTYAEKQKMLVPHRVAMALQDAGWIVRNDVVWHKPNPMPESATDRLSTTFEFVFHLTPHPDYYYDLDAIREPYADATVKDAEAGYGWNPGEKMDPSAAAPHGDGGINDPDSSRDEFMHPDGKNPGDVFELPTKSFPDAHFAVYPPALCEKPVKATCPAQVCAACGTPADCDCETTETEPGIVLDPFAGAGTTCKVAKALDRRFIGIELNPEYVALAQKRVGVTVDNPGLLLADDERPLTAFGTGGDG